MAAMGKVSGDAPEQSYALLRKVLPKGLQPYLRGLRKTVLKEGYRDQEPFCHIFAHTQSTLPRQDSILKKTSALVADRIDGDFVECGVLDGGTAAIMAYACRSDTGRRVHLFDAWQGLPESTEKDGEGARKWVGEVVGSPRRVVQVLKKVGARMDGVVFHKGWFHDTLPTAGVERVAFLHIDCDFYDPTMLVLETFVPKMVSGGYIQIDDYVAFEGCRLAVDEFLERHPHLSLVVEDKPGGAIWIAIP